eukprot:2976152-Prymnesium_polylepis.1
MPMLHLSVRITHAIDLHKTCLKYYVEEMRDDGENTPIDGMRIVCYKEGDESVTERCKASQLVISPETMAFGGLGYDISRFASGVLVLDEAVSFAISLGKETKGTITDPGSLVDILRHLVNIMPHVVVMDRDLTLTPIASKFLACIAPDRDVDHVQLEAPGQRNALYYTFDHKEHAKVGLGRPLAMDRLKLNLARCKQSFEHHPDDPDDPMIPRTGPKERRRLLIAVGSKKKAETHLIPLLDAMGITYRFYHQGTSDKAVTVDGEASKLDLSDTTVRLSKESPHRHAFGCVHRRNPHRNSHRDRHRTQFPCTFASHRLHGVMSW